jgi:tripartite-type tricarboxylate transporter receptor subunit TctC
MVRIVNPKNQKGGNMMKRHFYQSWRFRTALTVIVCFLPIIAVTPGWTADFPEKDRVINIIVGYSAGGSTDVGARIMASGLEKELGTKVMVENKPGASGQVGYTALTQTKPDGYTFGTINFPSAIVSYVDPARKAVYNRKSFELLALHVIDPALFAVKKDSPYKTLKDLFDAAKANPKKITISTTGVQSDEAFAILRLQKITDTKFALVQFTKGVSTAIPAFLGGKIDVLCANVGDLLSQYKSGEVRILGVMDNERSPFYPDVKTFEEQGYKISSSASRGYALPAGTPPEVVNTLSNAMKKVVSTEEHRQRMKDMGLTLRYMDPAQYNKYWTEYEEMIRELLPLTKE